MNKLINLGLLLLISFPYYTFSASSEKVEVFLQQIDLKKFSDDIKKIKEFKKIEEIDELNYNLKPFFKNLRYWYYFDEENFYSEFRHKLNLNFKEKELEELIQFTKNPFVVKMLNKLILRRDLFEFSNNIIDYDYKYPEFAESRYDIMNALYDFIGGDIQSEYTEKKLHQIIGDGKTTLTVLSKSRGEKIFINPNELKNRYNNTKKFIVDAIAFEMRDVRHYEVREFIRLLKKNKKNQLFVQLYANFHFLYMMKYIDKIELDKMNLLKTISTD